MTHLRVALALVATLLASGCAAQRESILSPVYEQVRMHPAMQVEDVYKLVHQAAFGNGHLITDEGEARRYLLAELESVKADDTEQLVEAVSANVTVVRVNLRPFKARRLDPERLVEAMLASARAFHPDPRVFERDWKTIVDAAAHGSLPWPAEALIAFGNARKAEGYPAIHHSDVYNARYQPAYRVVTSSEASKVMGAGPRGPAF
jgi:hypothetical protein